MKSMTTSELEKNLGIMVDSVLKALWFKKKEVCLA